MLDKALITRADDFGSSHSANQAIYEVSKKGNCKKCIRDGMCTISGGGSGNACIQ